MIFNLNPKAMLSFALLSFVAASPLKVDEWATCQFVVTQAGGYTDIRDLGNAVLWSVVGNIQKAWSPDLGISGGMPFDFITPLPSGKTQVKDFSLSVESKTAVELIALLESWEGQTLEGYEGHDFTVHETDCVDVGEWPWPDEADEAVAKGRLVRIKA